jgi:aminoglycoside 6-adenylyltransferase
MAEDFHRDEIILHIIAWAESRPEIRAVILTSSRANPNAPVDLFTDYDVILAVTDIRPFFESRDWLEEFGRVLVLWRDPIQREYDAERFAYITQYEDGLKIDFSVWSKEFASRLAADLRLIDELDVGYEVLLDKDGLSDGWKPPSYKAHIPNPPSEEEYLTEIETFFHEATYTAKHLWRDELMPAKYNLDKEMKADNLLRMLEWLVEVEHAWSLKPGAYGRFLKKRLPPEMWAELETTYVGADPAENWEALFHTIDLYRRIAFRVGEALGYDYPFGLHHRVVEYLQKVRALGRDARQLF